MGDGEKGVDVMFVCETLIPAGWWHNYPQGRRRERGVGDRQVDVVCW